MKQISYYIFVFLYLFLTIDIDAQDHIRIDTVSISYFNGIVQQSEILVNYNIRNESNDTYLTWVSLSPKDNRSDIELIHSFFIKRKGDFNFIQMMFDNLLDNTFISIGYSFIKEIPPQKNFSYIIQQDSNLGLYRDRIVLVKKKTVEQYLKMRIEQNVFYQLSSILLRERSNK